MDGSQLDEGFWRGRAEELQHALDSRVVVEQANGVLAERLGLDVKAAFSVLRGAARSERIKVQDLARTVVNNNDTPQTIISFLARNPDLFHVSSRDERVIRTEEFFKRVNDTMRNELGDRDGPVPLGQPAAVGPQHERYVGVADPIEVEQVLEHHLASGRRQQVVAAQHVGHAVRCVVDDDGQRRIARTCDLNTGDAGSG